MPLKIESAEFEEILPLWKEGLWANRESPIKPVSSMLYLGGYDMNIYSTKAHFWKVLDDHQKIVGVNSGFETAPGQFRSRGLYLHPDFRGQGLSQILLEECISYAHQHGYFLVWSLPRKSALSAYKKAGFQQTSDWIEEGMEFGPNCYVALELPRS